MDHDAFKVSTERLVAHAFLRFRGENQDVLEASRAGKPDEPDVVYIAGDGRTCGVEVTAGFYGPADARQFRTLVTDLARDGRRQTIMSTSGVEDEDLPAGLIRNPDGKLAVNLQAALEDHCRKHYAIATDLVLDGGWAPLTSADDAPAILAGLRKPDDCPYREVFLCLTKNWDAGRAFFLVS